MGKMRASYQCIVTIVYKKKDVEIDDNFMIKQMTLNESLEELEERAENILIERYSEGMGGYRYTPKEWKKLKKRNKVKIHFINIDQPKY